MPLYTDFPVFDEICKVTNGQSQTDMHRCFARCKSQFALYTPFVSGMPVFEVFWMHSMSLANNSGVAFTLYWRPQIPFSPLE